MQKEKKLKKTYIHKNCISTGNLFFDKIVGGFSLGTTVLLIQDNFSKIHNIFLRYFIAEGMVKNNKNILICSNSLTADNILEKIPYKSTQVESLLNAKKISDVKNDEMKIAWRYESIKYSNVIEDIVQSSEYIFDISRNIQDSFSKNITIVKYEQKDTFLEKIEEITNCIVSTVQEYMINLSNKENNEGEEKEKDIESTKVRIIVPDFYNLDMISENDKNLNKLKGKLMGLKNIARSNNGVIFCTINKQDISSNVLNLLYYYFDYVFKINSFTMSDDKIEDYDGIFKIEKIPRINSLKMPMHSIESDTYGLINEKRKLIIEQVDIGVEIDRNTKVKEKDVNYIKQI